MFVVVENTTHRSKRQLCFTQLYKSYNLSLSSSCSVCFSTPAALALSILQNRYPTLRISVAANQLIVLNVQYQPQQSAISANIALRLYSDSHRKYIHHMITVFMVCMTQSCLQQQLLVHCRVYVGILMTSNIINHCILNKSSALYCPLCVCIFCSILS